MILNFRLYDTERCKMLLATDYEELQELFTALTLDCSLFSDPMPLAYYDDNFVIYDKDILRDSHSDELGVVVYDNDDCAWKVKTETTEEWLYNWLDCDVVGNAYENPELLKGIW